MSECDVFQIDESVEPGRPGGVTVLDPEGFYKTDVGWQSFQRNALISAGSGDVPIDQWKPVEMYAAIPGDKPATTYDYHICTGCFGVFSARAIEVLSPFLSRYFTLLPLTLEGRKAFTLRCVERVDCLDHARSKIKYFSGSRDVLRISRFEFNDLAVPHESIFAVSEITFGLFCTTPIADLIMAEHLRGIELTPVYRLTLPMA